MLLLQVNLPYGSFLADPLHVPYMPDLLDGFEQ
jgi:hypothetical protein